MANWTGFSMTSRGAELQAKVNAGSTTLTFTKLALGSGEAEGSLENLTELVHKEMDMTIKSISNEGNIVTLRSTITNKGISQAFYAREMGLYATDPDLGEILYAIQTDPKPDNIPVEGSATVVSEDFTANLIMSNTGNVSATLDSHALLTLEDLEYAKVTIPSMPTQCYADIVTGEISEYPWGQSSDITPHGNSPAIVNGELPPMSAVLVPQTIPAGTELLKISTGNMVSGVDSYSYITPEDITLVSGYRYQMEITLVPASVSATARMSVSPR